MEGYSQAREILISNKLCQLVISKRFSRHKSSSVTHTACCGPKNEWGNCSSHPTTDITNNGTKAIPENSEITSKICMLVFHSLSSSCADGPVLLWPTICPFSKSAIVPLTHGPSKAGQKPVGWLITTCMPLRIK